MTDVTINQYDVIELLEDLSAKLKKGMKGTVLEKFDEDNFEIEIVEEEYRNIGFDNQYTFTVKRHQINRVDK
jgi:hypothetical protein